MFSVTTTKSQSILAVYRDFPRAIQTQNLVRQSPIAKSQPICGDSRMEFLKTIVVVETGDDLHFCEMEGVQNGNDHGDGSNSTFARRDIAMLFGGLDENLDVLGKLEVDNHLNIVAGLLNGQGRVLRKGREVELYNIRSWDSMLILLDRLVFLNRLAAIAVIAICLLSLDRLATIILVVFSLLSLDGLATIAVIAHNMLDLGGLNAVIVVA
ncbi:hypothetical protein BOTNAR_0272g00140 [Botryotinia narcissicola]|uniref:Uncharacterized protein n=1 Tax=Botryotinia narcissicola TaxID=278944 RepID=A0A4Z1HYJ2_9HELO|nr:hypothetical protein BOTNAR_0272g00140 [Botryotinia narcissicola]